MIIVHLSGGFGNQLFSYAFGYALAKKRGEELYIDTAIQDAEWFFRKPLILETNITYGKRITYKIGRGILDRLLLNRLQYRSHIGFMTREIREQTEDKGKFNAEYLNISDKNIYMRGDWQNIRYFADSESEIIDRFTFRSKLSSEAIYIYNQIHACPQSVAVHCRRGDYVKLGVSMDSSYYFEAMEKMSSYIPNAVFYIFSEDIEWITQKFQYSKFDIRIVEYKSQDKDIEDFRLISSAANQIVCNSSYSWWAAYLNRNKDKRIICPCAEDGIWGHEFWPDDWEKIMVNK